MKTLFALVIASTLFTPSAFALQVLETFRGRCEGEVTLLDEGRELLKKQAYKKPESVPVSGRLQWRCSSDGQLRSLSCPRATREMLVDRSQAATIVSFHCLGH
jgi:hypothetical protein